MEALGLGFRVYELDLGLSELNVEVGISHDTASMKPNKPVLLNLGP